MECVQTAAPASAPMNCTRQVGDGCGVVDQNIVRWNPVISWLRRIERLKFAE